MNVLISKAALEWIEALADKGMFVVDANGKGDLAPEAKKIVGALHEALAGGDVEVTVKQAGAKADRDALDAKLDVAMIAANPVAKSGGVVFGP